jgi:PAS domain S-box-containing protein
VNEQFCAITGYAEDELLRLSFYDLAHPEDRDYDREVFRAVIRGELPKYVAEKRYVRKDGSVAWVHVESVLLHDEAGRPKHTVGVVMDITARKQAENALKDADRRKDEFLAMLAHELRNPLASMRNALELMRLTEPAETRLLNAREIMDRQLSHLTRLVDDLLDVSRITRGKVQLQKKQLVLQDLIHTVVDGAHPLMEAKDQILEVDVPPEAISLEADEARVTQVVGNLLTNASKFTPQGGRISVMAGRVGDRAVIRVKDTGLGIPKEAQARIFDLFAQEARTLDRSQGGLGIGLTLVKELVERHGGTVEVKSEGRARGSEFIVSLPVLPRAVVFGADDSEPAPSERRQGPMRILVVEDNEDAAESFRLLLEISGHEVRLAYDGKEGARVAEEFRPDIAFLDIGLPEIDGFELARRIRQNPVLKRTVLVALSGYGREEDKDEARAAGFDEHMTKPVEYKKIAAFLTVVSGAIISPEPSTALH